MMDGGWGGVLCGGGEPCKLGISLCETDWSFSKHALNSLPRLKKFAPHPTYTTEKKWWLKKIMECSIIMEGVREVFVPVSGSIQTLWTTPSWWWGKLGWGLKPELIFIWYYKIYLGLYMECDLTQLTASGDIWLTLEKIVLFSRRPNSFLHQRTFCKLVFHR